MEQFEIFPWDKNFETGIEVIDRQHRVLVGILNRLADSLANRSTQVELEGIFNELTEYADYHFNTEEHIWQTYLADDEWFARHQQTHVAFFDRIIELKRERPDKSYDQLVQDTVSFLAQWLAFHILDTDKRMAISVREMQAGAAADLAKQRANEEMSGSMRVLIQTVLRMYDAVSSRTMELVREKALRLKAEKELLESEDRWRFVLEGMGERIWDWHIAEQQASHSGPDDGMFDLMGEQVVEGPNASTIHPADIEQVRADLQAHLDGTTEFYVNKHRVLHANGGWSWVVTRGKVVARDADGQALRMVGTHSDITERELAALIFRHSSQAMLVCDAHNDIIAVNPAFSEITGYSAEEALGKNPHFLASGEHDVHFYEQMWSQIVQEGGWVGEIGNLRKGGDKFYASLRINSVLGDDDLIDHYIGLFSDITDQKRSEEIIIRQANYDPLTNLPNRRMNYSLLEQEIKRARRSRCSFALLFIDLDEFKEVNDTFSHEIGDRLLVEAARRMAECVRETDTIARFGGDEFTIIVTNLEDPNKVDRIADEVIGVLSQAFQLEGNLLYISASIGIALFPADADNASDLLSNADQAMYLSKATGRGRYTYFTQAMQQQAQQRRQVLLDLRRAIELQEFELHYQPIVDLSSMKLEKAEALLRWNHPDKGQVSPASFIPLAEESGLIVAIGHWVMEQVARQCREWRSSRPSNFQISINRSPVEFRSKENLNRLLHTLDEREFAASGLVVEITESLFLENEPDLLEQMLTLRDQGIEVALDDFGTGYSSLSYIKDFHIDYIKIDRSFVKNLESDEQAAALCEAIVSMAHKLSIKVVAEGVETEQEHRMLLAMGCDYGQGYLYSKPVTAQAFEALPRQFEL